MPLRPESNLEAALEWVDDPIARYNLIEDAYHFLGSLPLEPVVVEEEWTSNA